MTSSQRSEILRISNISDKNRNLYEFFWRL